METSWQQLKSIVAEASDLPVEQRLEFLRRACPDDETLRREAASLLDLEAPADAMIGRSPLADSSAERPVVVGQLLGSYRLLSRLGSGGMGDVYLGARADGAFDQQVAIKILKVSGLPAEYLDRFRAERQLLAELDHPNIARLLDGGATADGRPYLVMEYVEGTRIDLHCAACELSVEARLGLFVRVCEAVQHAHRHLIVHRDLKPANIMVTSEGDPKLLDFGIAKDLGSRALTPDTRLLVPVTPEYASPEQLRGAPVTTAVDVYALGVILHELLTGERPHLREGKLAASTASGLVDDTRAWGWLRRQRLGGDLDYIVLRGIATSASDRYPSVEEMSRDVKRHLEGRALEGRGGTAYRLGKWAHRHWRPLVAVVVVCLLATGLLGERLRRHRLEEETDRVSRLSDDLGQYLVDLLTEAESAAGGDGGSALEGILEQGAALLDDDAFADEPLMRASLLGAVGRVYRRQGRPREAEPLLLESLRLRREALPPDHPLIGLSSNNLALALRAQERYPEARRLLETALRIQRFNQPRDDPWTASMLNNLAGVEMKLGLSDASIDHFREALEMKRRLYDKENPEVVAKALKNLGVGLLEAGRLEEAEQVLREALAEVERLDSSDPLTRAAIEHHYGSLLRRRGKSASARAHLSRAVALKRQYLGPDHSRTRESIRELEKLATGK